MNLIKQPLKVKNTIFKNRIVMPPMATSKCINGKVTRDLIEYYQMKAQGGYLGLIITEHQYVSKDGMADLGQISIADDSDIEGLSKVVAAIHQYDTKVIAQISHSGSAANKLETGLDVISASALIKPGSTKPTNTIPIAMDHDMIKRVIDDFAKAAKRAELAGFDGVQIHSAHGYLLNQFYSPLANLRHDDYGGSLAKRVRIHLEIIAAIKAIVSDDFLITLRLGASDYMEGGSTIKDGVAAAKLFAAAGVDILDISGGFGGFKREAVLDPVYFSDASLAIKEEVSIPIILTGGITDKQTAECLLLNKKADLIGVGRAILKDNDWAKKVIESS